MQLFYKIVLLLLLLLSTPKLHAQLNVVPENNALRLAQTLVGEGVSISNVTFTGNPLMAALFYNVSGTNIGIDSGIVLTSGRAASTFLSPLQTGINGNGTTAASAIDADNGWALPGDADLAAAISTPVSELEDACVLEFDFVPLGDSIKFRYVFSSEEYVPAFVCDYNDAFAFFISGPGITGLKNVALIPGTSTPVSIFNVNDVPGGACPNNVTYYVDNLTNTFFMHDGHTRVLSALEQVQPCQTYHLKLVISDVGDDAFDSGVLLEAKSLSSNVVKIENITQVDPGGNSYLVEGCALGSIKVKRPYVSSSSLVVNLSYGGTALNGVDVQTLPAMVTIPANQTEVVFTVSPIIDNISEGIEILKIYALAGSCSSGAPTDSAQLQIRDFDILGITPDTARICKGNTIQLNATNSYTTYQWDANSTLSNTTIYNPFATPVDSATKYICTAQVGTCRAKDSAYVVLKQLDFISKQNINCRNGTTGQISVQAGGEWTYPVEFSINNAPYQPDSNFTNLPVGTYRIKVKDAVGCLDSMDITLLQAHPDLVINTIDVLPAGCSGLPDGSITVNSTGGLSPYVFSNDGINYQASNIFNVVSGNYLTTLKDVNGCIATQNIFVPLNDTVIVDAGIANTICEGKTTTLNGSSNATQLLWWPSIALSSATTLSTNVSPSSTTKYYLTATVGICVHTDSVIVNVNPAPIANAGADKVTCYGEVTKLNGNGGVEFTWRPATFLNSTTIKNPTSNVKASYSYKLWVKDALGCESLQADEVNIKVIPQVKVFAGNDTTVSIHQPLQLNAIELSNSGVNSYTWSPSLGLNNNFISNPIASLDRDAILFVTGVTPDGCFASDYIKVRVIKGPDIYVPSGFTPNGDGLNDVLHAIPVGIKLFKYFNIYNRWGQLVFSTSDPKQGWTGKINSTVQANTSFVWMAEGIDYKGNVIQRKGSTIALQ